VEAVSKQASDRQGPPEAGDAELVRAARRGDLGAFEVLVARYQRQATAVSYRLLNNRDDAMDVVQDAMLKAYDKLDTLKRPSHFGPWLMRIVNNLSLNKRRSRALRKAASLDAIAAGGDEDGRGELNRPDTRTESPVSAASAEEVKELIARAIENLPDMQRQALVLFSMEGMPQKEVARLLGCSVEAVKWHVFTARKKLKEKLKDYL
jgi:RNA polymerase sigma-70 factor (ECF subfamily)